MGIPFRLAYTVRLATVPLARQTDAATLLISLCVSQQ